MPPTVVPMSDEEPSAIPGHEGYHARPYPCAPSTLMLAFMRSAKDVEAYLTRLNRQFQQVDGESGTYIIPSNGTQNALRVDPPLVVLRVHIGDVKKGDADLALFRRLLQLNARGLVHASYGIDDDRIV